MGDRGNIFVRSQYQQPEPEEGEEREPLGVYLYSHWGGSELPLALKAALSRKQRWDDGPYLTRIIFDEMTKGQQGEETGFGISCVLCDNEHPIIRVDPGNQTVSFGEFEATFAHYIEVEDETLLTYFNVSR